MAIHDQWIKQVNFVRLKNILNCTISFDSNLVGILGVNGSGKSTILHALACMYKPVNHSSNYLFSHFFTPNTHSRWNGSKMILSDKYKDNGISKVRDHVEFKKESRWTPKYERRIERHVVFIGIKSCVPSIESETQTGRINFNTIALATPEQQKVKDLASYILNRNYEEFNSHKAFHKSYIGVKHNNTNYCSLAMGAGEQRVFYILQQIINAPNSALILIDEIDLLLHKEALRRLLGKINELAIEKKLQVIFTTHNHSVLKLDFIQFKHLFQTDDRTLCLDNATPDVMYRLTGEQRKPIKIYVEDDLSIALMERIVGQLQIRKSVEIQTFGSSNNCFTCAAGIILMNKDANGLYFILDGDVYRSDEDKITQLKKVLSGTEDGVVAKREEALRLIKQYCLPENVKPEKYYHECILAISDDLLDADEKEYKNAAREIVIVADDHKYISDIITRMGVDRKVGLSSIVKIISKSEQWNEIVSDIIIALEAKKAELNL